MYSASAMLIKGNVPYFKCESGNHPSNSFKITDLFKNEASVLMYDTLNHYIVIQNSIILGEIHR